MTTGVACWEKPGPKPEPSRVIQAPLTFLTLERLIVASGEYRVLPQSPPTTGQSFAGGFRRSIGVWAHTNTERQKTAAPRAYVVRPRNRCSFMGRNSASAGRPNIPEFR